MENTSSLFSSPRLDSSNGQIRLLDLHGAPDFEDLIVCDLRPCFLTDKDLRYTTLSY
jgi:hypothetical protein